MAEEIKLVRVPINTQCVDPECKKPLPFGSWAYYNADSEVAICPTCGTKRGWSSKDRVDDIIKKLELQEDIKALKKQRKIESDALFLLRETIDLHRLGERDLDLEKQIERVTTLAEDYMQKCASPEEKAAFQAFKDGIRETQALQKDVRQFIESRMFLLERTQQKRKKQGLWPLEAPEP